jgi:hypothetical protein
MWSLAFFAAYSVLHAELYLLDAFWYENDISFFMTQTIICLCCYWLALAVKTTIILKQVKMSPSAKLVM